MSNKSILDEIKFQFNSGTMIKKLIFVNLGVFLLFNILLTGIILPISTGRTGNYYFEIFMEYFAAPSNFSELIWKPWTIITYMFGHHGFMHLLFNMVLLFFAGRAYSQWFGTRHLLSMYLLGGFAGWLVFALVYNISPAFQGSSILIGASASVTAILVALAAHSPNYPIRFFFIPFTFPLKYMVLITVIGDMFRLAADINDPLGNAGGWLSHLGGAAFGYFSIKLAQQGKMDINIYFEQFLLKIERFFIRKKGPKVVYRRSANSKQNKKTVSDEEFNSNKVQKEKQLNEILDKINRSGYESLSKAEKEFLFKSSNQ